jgi:hypothetical protein
LLKSPHGAKTTKVKVFRSNVHDASHDCVWVGRKTGGE